MEAACISITRYATTELHGVATIQDTTAAAREPKKRIQNVS
jgi:hypothetical protein